MRIASHTAVHAASSGASQASMAGEAAPANEVARAAQLCTAPIQPVDEHHRLADLRQRGILDTPPEADFDRLLRIACLLCGVPMGAISFVDAERTWYKSALGLPVREIERNSSLCAYAIVDPGRLLEIPDVAGLSWAKPRPWGARGPELRFYAGVPLQLRDGSAVGVLCVMDREPRQLGASQREGLKQIAGSIAALMELRQQVRTATQTDRLTGLPNWFHFEAQFDAMRASCGVFCFVRLKAINQINSAHGFRVADALIRQAAERLRSFAGAEALVGRIKRGLFLLFFPAAQMGPFLNEQAPVLVRRLQAPYREHGLDLACPVNLGFAEYPRDGATLDDAVNAADAALQVAIEREQAMAFFDRSVDTVRASHYRLEPRLRRAIAQGEFVNYYQPKVDVATGRIVGAEALVRWNDPQRGLVPPHEFVPALESTGLIVDAASRLLDRAVRDFLRWREAGLQAPRIAVNIAAAQLRDEGFVDRLRQALADLGGDTSALGIEVTENILIADMDRAVAVLARVRDLGIPVSIDDFGTGYSSLSYIVTLPIDELKIDRSFVKKMSADAAYESIVRTCISLAHGLGLRVVAEGVETEAQLKLLAKLRCDQSQGFLHAPPLPAELLAERLRTA